MADQNRSLLTQPLPEPSGVIDSEYARELVNSIQSSEGQQQLQQVHLLSSLVEAQEARYRGAVGDPHASPALRSHYPIGKLLSAIKDDETAYESVLESMVFPRTAELEQQVAGLRLVAACLECWGFQYPLTDEDLVRRLGEWAAAGLQDAPVPGDLPAPSHQALLAEARSVYALALLGISLANEEYGDEAVRTPLVLLVCSYLQQAVLSPSSLTALLQQRQACVATAAPAADPSSSGMDSTSQQVGGSSSSSSMRDDLSRIRCLRVTGALRCLMCTGEYLEALGPFLQHRGPEVCLTLLQQGQQDGPLLFDTLQVLCSVLAHRKLGELWVEQDGLHVLLSLPRNVHTDFGLSLALFGLASLPSAFQQACALPPPIPSDMVSTALGLLTCNHDSARKNAALFLGNAFQFPVVLEAFDQQDGLAKLLYPIRAVIALLRQDEEESRADRQVAFHTCRAFLQYVRAHLLLLVQQLRQQASVAAAAGGGQHHAAAAAGTASTAGHVPLPGAAQAVDEAIAAVQGEPLLARAMVGTAWRVLPKVASQQALQLMLELVHWAPAEQRYFHEMVLYALESLQLLTLAAVTRGVVVGALVGSHPARKGMAVLLQAATPGVAAYRFPVSTPEIVATALQVVTNCVAPPPALADLMQPRSITPVEQPGATPRPPDKLALPALDLGPAALPPRHPAAAGASSSPAGTWLEQLQQQYTAARAACRQAGGIRALISLLQQSRAHFAPAQADKLRALACGALLGLTQDEAIQQMLTRLQVGKLLAELLRERGGAGGGAGSGGQGEEGPGGTSGAGADWPTRFHSAALALIAATSDTGRTLDSSNTATANDVAAPTLLRMERAAVASATQLTYPPQELLLLVYEHLKASGLHSSAATLAKEAALGRGQLQQAEAVPAAAADRPGGGAVVVLEPGSAFKEESRSLTFGRNLLQSAAALKEQQQQQQGAVAATPVPASQGAGLMAQPSKASTTATKQAHSQQQQQQQPVPHFKEPMARLSSPPPPYLGLLTPSPAQHVAPGGSSSKRRASWGPVAATPAAAGAGAASRAASGAASGAGAGAAGGVVASGSKRRKVSASAPGGVTTEGQAEAAATARGEEWLRQRHWGSPAPVSPHRHPQTPAAAVASTPAPAAAAAPSSSQQDAAAAAGQRPSAADAGGGGGPRELSPYQGPIDHALTLSPSQRSRGGGGRSSFHTAAGGADPEVPTVQGNPLLSHLPSRLGRPGVAGLVRRHSGGIDGPQRMTPVAAGAALEPKELPLHVRAAARYAIGAPTPSRLSSIVMSYLRSQHRAACLSAAQPVAVLPPVSLLHPYRLPQAALPWEAPRNLGLRRMRVEQLGAPGGRGGARQDRALLFSRFRLNHMARDEGSLMTSVTFLAGYGNLVVGSAAGELRQVDGYTQEEVEVVDAHSAPVTLLQAHSRPGSSHPLLLSSSRSEVKLWKGDLLEAGPSHTWEGLMGARFHPTGQQMVGITSMSPRQAKIYDINGGHLVTTLDMDAEAAAAAAGGAAAGAAAVGGGGGGGAADGEEGGRGRSGRQRYYASACFNHTGELVLWGTTLWDPRVPTCLHTFDQLSASVAGAFHPSGLELLLNSEVWDLRTYRLLRSVPGLDGTTVQFNAAGDVMYAHLRRTGDPGSKLRRHPLATAFRTLDARSYQEIAAVDVRGHVMGLALEPSDTYVAAVCMDPAWRQSLEGGPVSTLKVYEVGRAPPSGEDDTDDEAHDEEEEDEEEEEERGGAGGARSSSDDGLDAMFAAAGVEVGAGGQGEEGGADGEVVNGGGSGTDAEEDEFEDEQEEMERMYQQLAGQLGVIDSDDLLDELGEDEEDEDDDDELLGSLSSEDDLDLDAMM